MTIRRTWRHTVAAMALVGLSAACGGGSGDAPRTGAAIDAQPGYLDITLPTLDGAAELTLRQFAGRPVIVNFFASWCVPCVVEMPDIENVKRQVGPTVAFVGINVDDTVDDARALVERTGVTWELARDPDSELLSAVGVVAMPTTLVLGQDGKIIEHHTGAISASRLRDLIADRLEITVAENDS